MYVPRHFATDELAALRELLPLAPLTQLISMTDAGLVATAVPMLLVERSGNLLLQGHVARANHHWERFDPSVESLVIVAGPDAYVSPNSYATKAETHQVVPTWNYESVHAIGSLVAHDDPAWVLDLVTRLTDAHEAARTDAWKVSDAPADYIDVRLRGIVGVELTISRLQAKAKLSQDKSDADRSGAERALAIGSAAERAVADRMRLHRSAE